MKKLCLWSCCANTFHFIVILVYVTIYFFDFQMRHKLLDSHANVKDLNLLEAKMNFVKAWQSLPDFGVSLFVVRFHGEKKDELLGIAYNRIMRMSLQTGDHIKTWRYNTIKVRSTEHLNRASFMYAPYSAVYVLLFWFYPYFISILSWFYPDFFRTYCIQIYPDFILIFERIWINSGYDLVKIGKNTLYPDFILIYPCFVETHFILILSWSCLDGIWIKSG